MNLENEPLTIPFRLHDALPELVIQKRDDGWYAYIVIDWESSFDGDFWPGDDAQDGHPDWTKATGPLALLGTLASNMDWPTEIELGKVPDGFVVDGQAWSDREQAERWATAFVTKNHPAKPVKHVDPDNITAEEVISELAATL